MKVENLVQAIGADFYTGVPDSQLKALCNYLIKTYGIDDEHHVIAANEGNCTALAAGYHLATGKVPVVYMQNSGEGNVINPVASLLNENVYAIPVFFIIGWRGEPGIHDEPQHVYQGKVTCTLLETMDIPYHVIGKETTDEAAGAYVSELLDMTKSGKAVALVIRKGALTYEEKVKYANDYSVTREDIIKHIIEYTGEDPIVSTTGKASRELFEAREAKGQGHGLDFLTVGSMGHSSSIALGIAAQKPERKVWCVDGDGAVLMHMGSLAVLGSSSVKNLVHIVINNGAHETVGGMPTVASKIDLPSVAKACGYSKVISVATLEDLDRELAMARETNELVFLEVKCGIGAREDLGRPTTTALENKLEFMKKLL